MYWKISHLFFLAMFILNWYSLENLICNIRFFLSCPLLYPGLFVFFGYYSKVSSAFTFISEWYLRCLPTYFILIKSTAAMSKPLGWFLRHRFHLSAAALPQTPKFLPPSLWLHCSWPLQGPWKFKSAAVPVCREPWLHSATLSSHWEVIPSFLPPQTLSLLNRWKCCF